MKTDLVKYSLIGLALIISAVVCFSSLYILSIETVFILALFSFVYIFSATDRLYRRYSIETFTRFEVFELTFTVLITLAVLSFKFEFVGIATALIIFISMSCMLVETLLFSVEKCLHYLGRYL